MNKIALSSQGGPPFCDPHGASCGAPDHGSTGLNRGAAWGMAEDVNMRTTEPPLATAFHPDSPEGYRGSEQEIAVAVNDNLRSGKPVLMQV